MTAFSLERQAMLVAARRKWRMSSALAILGQHRHPSLQMAPSSIASIAAILSEAKRAVGEGSVRRLFVRG